MEIINLRGKAGINRIQTLRFYNSVICQWMAWPDAIAWMEKERPGVKKCCFFFALHIDMVKQIGVSGGYLNSIP